MNNYSSLPKRILILLFILVTTGCAKQHAVEVHGDSLSLKYRDGKAKEVLFAFSGDNFQYHKASSGPEHVWRVEIPLQKRFTYFFIVDGVVTVPDCRDKVLDDFGGTSCFYEHRM